MKKQLLTTLFACTFLLSCSNENISEKKMSSESFSKGRCPEGTTEVWTYEADGFRFKRPKFNCESGFWFCTYGGGWVFEGCKDSSGNIWPATPSTTINKTNLVAFPSPNNTITILFPKELINKPGNTLDDFKIFSVDEEISIGDMKLKAGSYNTTLTNETIVVKVPIY